MRGHLRRLNLQRMLAVVMSQPTPSPAELIEATGLVAPTVGAWSPISCQRGRGRSGRPSRGGRGRLHGVQRRHGFVARSTSDTRTDWPSPTARRAAGPRGDPTPAAGPRRHAQPRSPTRCARCCERPAAFRTMLAVAAAARRRRPRPRHRLLRARTWKGWNEVPNARVLEHAWGPRWSSRTRQPRRPWRALAGRGRGHDTCAFIFVGTASAPAS